ncbi:DUF2520 domain-containing protein [Gordonia amarae]|uniref:Oxidoreductase n=2 Tax=Gordonia amarae TaxID=36821 RepID=G7GW12_9ACTN|nr:DUF2520 domain-containing protein [Gordonia amarae]MCS3880558.1 putative short-subunit dehydrogenase-like oxidoreductase (DUF2520 family) [Gordonia amarae]QHN18883.1 DUF2520 domain-containing protein [Gordonia amarae]QHN23358.1 DUF2520 domain-containing protein [Gordonia amarae]QHN32258.1 DUF2520 domain-containing protein [Gordonia amarae]QHN41006.1 DUF2520 domain-containing protein [Gordonia amarae]
MTSPFGGGDFELPDAPGPGTPGARDSAFGSGAAEYLPGVSNLPAPARLSVGIISAGRVGTALGEALEKAGHVVAGVVARSPRSRERAAVRLPESPVLDVDGVVSRSELIIISVPDAELPAVIARIASCPGLRPSTLVAHTAGAHGVGILDPITARGALPLALHPAMTFVGSADDTVRLHRACFGITAADAIGDAIGASLVMEMGGEPVRIPEAHRTLYHAALAHGANHLIALISDAVAALNAAIDGEAGAANATVDGDATRLAERILGPLVTASLSNVLELGPSALTGPVARGDAAAVSAHLAALTTVPDGDGPHGIADAYRTQARRAAAQSGAPTDLIEMLEEQ